MAFLNRFFNSDSAFLTKVQPWVAIKQAFRFGFQNYFEILKALWLVFLIQVTLAAVQNTLMSLTAGGETNTLRAAISLYGLAVFVANLFLNAIVFTHIHRRFAGLKVEPTKNGGLVWGPMPSKMVTTFLKLLLIALAGAVLFATLGGLMAMISRQLEEGVNGGTPLHYFIGAAWALGGAALFIAVLCVLVRSAIMLPATALEDEIHRKLKGAWALTRGNSLRLMVAAALLLAVFSFTGLLVTLLTSALAAMLVFFSSTLAIFTSVALFYLYYFLTVIIGASLISVVYQQMTGSDASKGKPEKATEVETEA